MAASNRGCASASDSESELNDQQSFGFLLFPKREQTDRQGCPARRPFFCRRPSGAKAALAKLLLHRAKGGMVLRMASWRMGKRSSQGGK